MSYEKKSKSYKKNKYNVRNIIHSSDEEDYQKDLNNKKFFINNVISNFFVIKKNIPDLYKDTEGDCIGPCFPKDNFVYNPINFVLKKSQKNICPIKPYQDSNENINFKECTYNGDKNYLNFDVLNNNNPYLLISKNDNYFLKEIYNLNNINQVYDFINNELNNLPIYSQKRIINAIFNAYIRDELFPNNFYVNYVKNLLSSIYNIKLSSDKILNNILKIKNKEIIQIDDIFNFLFNKYFE